MFQPACGGGLVALRPGRVEGDHGAVGPHDLGQEALGLPVGGDLGQDQVVGRDEVQLPDVADLGEGGGHPAPVEDAQQADGGEALRPQVELPGEHAVLGGAQVRGEPQAGAAAVGVEQAAPVDPGPDEGVVHHRLHLGRRDGVPRVEHLVPGAGRGSFDDAFAARGLHVVGADEVAAQLLDGTDQIVQVAGRVPVVAVEEGDVVALGGLDAGVAGLGDAPVLLVAQQSGARQFAHRVVEDLRGGVRRAVVDQDELRPRARVVREAAQGVLRVVLNVVEGDDD